MIAGPVVEPFYSLPDDISVLLDEERSEGHRLVLRLVHEWDDESNRFDQPGEIALCARLGGRLVGVGGLNRDPYIDDPAVARIRHVFVSPGARGSGVGRRLVEQLVGHARQGFRRVRLRTVTTDGSMFYRALGFEETDEQDATHQFVF